MPRAAFHSAVQQEVGGEAVVVKRPQLGEAVQGGFLPGTGRRCFEKIRVGSRVQQRRQHRQRLGVGVVSEVAGVDHIVKREVADAAFRVRVFVSRPQQDRH